MGRGERNWLFAVDESGSKSTPHFGFGALVMPWERRGDFQTIFRTLRERHSMQTEVKWKRINRRTYTFMTELVDTFFRTNWLSFHCMVVRKADINKALSRNDYDLAWRKHLTSFVSKKCARCVNLFPNQTHTVRVWIDPIQSRYSKADEALEIIANYRLKKEVADHCRIVSVRTHQSHETAAIQLCDVLLGAVVTSWLRDGTGELKPAMRSMIADKLGWPDLKAGTYQSQRKFNIWYFWDGRTGPRQVHARPIYMRTRRGNGSLQRNSTQAPRPAPVEFERFP